MKNSRTRVVLALGLALLLPIQLRAQAEVLNNDAVVQMVTGKVPKSLIITKIQTTATAFDLSPAALVSLHTNKVPDDVAKQMMMSTKSDGKEVLTNADIVSMVTGSVGKDLILLKIQNTKGQYDLTATGLVSLNQSKVSQDIVKAMMTPKPAAAAAPPPTTPPQTPPPPPPPPTRGGRAGGGGR